MASGAFTYQKQTIKFGRDTKEYGRVKLGPNITIPQKCHDDLLEYCKVRLLHASTFRDPCVDRFTEIDKEISGFIVPTKEDRQRIKDNMAGKGPKMVDENVQFALMQLDEAVTYLMGVIVAQPGMYQAITVKDKQNVANDFAGVMNDHARIYKHYRHMAKGLLDSLKFNFGGYICEWDTEKGPKIVGNDTLGGPDIKLDEYVRTGNRLIAVDPYNTLWDPAICPVDVPRKGEFFATVETIRPYILKKMEANGELAQLDRISLTDTRAYTYYKFKPMLQHYHVQQGGSRTDWDSYWTNNYGSNNQTYDPEALEKTVIYVWLVPSHFKLSSSNVAQIWRLWIINNQYIIRADQMNNVHNQLPAAFMMPNEDGLNLQSRTFGEMLLPFQRAASAQLNIHQKAMRKKLYGITFYNRRIMPLFENSNLEGGKIPVNPVGTGELNLNNQVLQINDAPDTSRTMEDVTSLLAFMQKILPATQPGQVADLDRATRYQAAALVQASNRRNQKLAKIIDDQALDELRRMMMTNIMQYQPAIETVDEKTGEVKMINPKAFREVKIEFAIADGMRGLDKLLITDSLREVINMLLQSQVAGDYDIGGIINYYLELQGDKMDFNQFKYKSPMDALPAQVRDMAFAPFQEAVKKMSPEEQKAIAQASQGGAPPAGGNTTIMGAP